ELAKGQRRFNHVSFLFRAEDGIRDLYVTGVQTCALPILATPRVMAAVCFQAGSETAAISRGVATELGPLLNTQGKPEVGPFVSRSEERRVGKECRSQRWEDRQKQKTAGILVNLAE